jgi:hypothetical protein
VYTWAFTSYSVTINNERGAVTNFEEIARREVTLIIGDPFQNMNYTYRPVSMGDFLLLCEIRFRKINVYTLGSISSSLK